MEIKRDITITEVGPRDGLQNEKRVFTLEERFHLINLLLKTGLNRVEVGSFVRSDRLPQMANTEKLYQQLEKIEHDKDQKLYCLVPNTKGITRALEAKVTDLAFFTATSETFNRKNIGMGVKESLVEIDEMFKLIGPQQQSNRLYISTVFGCPYEGLMQEEKFEMILDWSLKKNFQEIVLGDTIGIAVPKKIRRTLEIAKKYYPIEKIVIHVHDTYGMGIANIYAALEAGVRSFDGSVGGLGGCPYAAGASGNVATEEIVYLCEGQGLKTGINLDQLLESANYALSLIGRMPTSKLDLAYMSKKTKSVN